MDGNTTLTMGFILAIIGGISLVSGLLAKRDSKKLQEGENQGVLKATLKTMDETLKSIRSENERFQKDHREEHVQLDKRMKDVEDYVLIQKNRSKKTKSDIEE
ncbi:MAG TPA: hypothetical protein VFH18_09130 [Erysipelotrichaceae bacterium]|nr:hypothetical protein [Erysipelotrichaceae bacterium]